MQKICLVCHWHKGGPISTPDTLSSIGDFCAIHYGSMLCLQEILLLWNGILSSTCNVIIWNVKRMTNMGINWPITFINLSSFYLVNLHVNTFLQELSHMSLRLLFLFFYILSGFFTVSSQQLCTSNPCYFNGTCTETGNNDYSCQCPSGFTGKK